jgi:hypothetical protein
MSAMSKAGLDRRLMGVGPDASMPIQLLPQLENDAGELAAGAAPSKPAEELPLPPEQGKARVAPKP